MINKLRLGLLLLAIFFILTGLFDGEARLVLMKSINICLECVGIG